MNKIRLIINNDIKKNEKQRFFIKKELQSILNLYARMVSNGSWKDYSFSTGSKEVSFDVYQRASEKPVLRITKNLKPNHFNEKYLIKDFPKKPSIDPAKGKKIIAYSIYPFIPWISSTLMEPLFL